MSENKLLNAIIALLEDRPADARDMLRSPEMRITSNEVQSRLASAIAKRESSAIVFAIKSMLRVSLKADAERFDQKWNEDQKEAFLQGVAHVETIMENYIEELDA